MKTHVKTLISLVMLALLLAVAAQPVTPAGGQAASSEQCDLIRRMLDCRCLFNETPDTVIVLRPLTDEEVAEYAALYEALGCTAFETTEEPEPTATPKPKRCKGAPETPGAGPAGATATPDGPQCAVIPIPEGAVHIQLVEDTRLLWAPDAAAQTEYTVPAGTTAWQIALDESGEYAALAWTCVVIYVPVEHTAPVSAG